MYTCIHICMYIYRERDVIMITSSSSSRSIIYIYVCVYVCIYIYIYIERERYNTRGLAGELQLVVAKLHDLDGVCLLPRGVSHGVVQLQIKV